MSPALSQGEGASQDPTLHLPRILCLHGGGTNARIFRSQCRRLSAQLNDEFRFVYAEGPFDSQAGPDVMSVYSEWGPFKRWLRWRPEHPELKHEATVAALDDALAVAVGQDDARGATGEVVALLGFSQGAKLAVSLLYRQQVRAKTSGRHFAGSNYRFGILLAGRAPIVDIGRRNELRLAGLPDASAITDAKRRDDKGGHVLRIPTIHVHGLRDPGLELHRQLLENCCESGSSALIEWDGNHRVPLKQKDVGTVVDKIREFAMLTGL